MYKNQSSFGIYEYTVLTFSLALRARENIKAVSLFVEMYFISTQNKQISSIYFNIAKIEQ